LAGLENTIHQNAYQGNRAQKCYKINCWLVLQDENGCTPLMFAAMKNHPHCVNELLLHGADLTRRNVNADTAVSLAMRNSARAAQTVLENSILAALSSNSAAHRVS
jgi:ankyrin repeat protein